jgi:hypothetical protein
MKTIILLFLISTISVAREPAGMTSFTAETKLVAEDFDNAEEFDEAREHYDEKLDEEMELEYEEKEDVMRAIEQSGDIIKEEMPEEEDTQNEIYY